MYSDDAVHWRLSRDVTYLNHGSFGATPRPVLDEQSRLRDAMEAEPIDFLARRLEAEFDRARTDLAEFLKADTEGLAFVPNATTGINAVLSSLTFQAGDEIVVTSHEYNATKNIVNAAAARAGARVVMVDLPFQGVSSEPIVERVTQALSENTRLVVIDHVTSQTALILPVEAISKVLEARGIELLVDGAHAPGMIPLDLGTLGATYYVGNCHKWMCAPKGSGFLYVTEKRRADIRPVVISHGANSLRSDRSRYHLEFDWTGTADPTPYLCIPSAIRFMEGLRPGGWPQVIAENCSLSLRARELLCSSLGIHAPVPDGMIGSMASVSIANGNAVELQQVLRERHNLEPLVLDFPAAPSRVLRVSAQLYNTFEQYEQLVRALQVEGLGKGR